MVVSLTVFSSSERSSSDDVSMTFWQQWQQYRDYLYRCCVKWMGDPIDAEDALSRAMLKAWKKVQKYAGEIANFKAWLVTLTRNLCVDIHRERTRGANRVEDIEGYARSEEQELVAFENMPESVMETDERKMVIRRAIDNLPTRLRETFILHFYQELSHQEIVAQQGISYQNVCKRISQARAILREELKEYFIGEDGKDTDLSVPATATESEIGDMCQENVGVEARAGETMTLSVVEEVESVVCEGSLEVLHNVQHSEQVMVAPTSERKLEVKSDGCGCFEVALLLCEKQPTAIVALAQLGQESRNRENSFLTMQNIQQQHQVGEVVGEFVLKSGSVMQPITATVRVFFRHFGHLEAIILRANSQSSPQKSPDLGFELIKKMCFLKEG
ncbi:ECF subfamily RNA polymerase sigma-24 factor [Tolypothrix tenuis PCC 7101]|uniref:ECF subfamily RNA polymerase sigma-24 factor n=1 Tax=Tolypothrix tenuis PCC 7101 TaxID=231146 RepID=A0A1Z4N5G6_9CYAN|nr:sigma-70 family RNA polymerase sigma factor [Aulosira sp. FACHB-113]BAZ00935.1 ECF subfamily RNA polymerase sigma-24 factor [Tolypothrix tenuis PCC 7101]BAZ75142.1 ECF subfamily RNA polymerase sigma-24 factor [Aulosira laxa NIES-50]